MSLAATEEHSHKIELTRDTRWLAIHSHRQLTTVWLSCLAEVSNGSIKSKNTGLDAYGAIKYSIKGTKSFYSDLYSSSIMRATKRPKEPTTDGSQAS